MNDVCPVCRNPIGELFWLRMAVVETVSPLLVSEKRLEVQKLCEDCGPSTLRDSVTSLPELDLSKWVHWKEKLGVPRGKKSKAWS